MSEKCYCMMCGNKLDPKIHITKFGKSSKQMVEIQKNLLRTITKYNCYRASPEIQDGITELFKSLTEDVDELS